nr:hypothetical protein B0A51_06175 [Rachicladosporium sp. CCFEE 5018]
MKAAEPGVKRAEERDALKAEHERIYRFFQKRYGGDNTNLPAWQKLCVDAGVEVCSRIRDCKGNLDKIYVYIYQFRATIGAEPVENVAELVSEPFHGIATMAQYHRHHRHQRKDRSDHDPITWCR